MVRRRGGGAPFRIYSVGRGGGAPGDKDRVTAAKLRSLDAHLDAGAEPPVRVGAVGHVLKNHLRLEIELARYLVADPEAEGNAGAVSATRPEPRRAAVVGVVAGET